MQRFCTFCLIVCLAASTGCRVGCWGKRASEKRCPTDVRKTHFWCLGEDAVFHAPCGPTQHFYGHQPTCWRAWPASGHDWLDMYCAPPVGAVPGAPELVPAPYYEELPAHEEGGQQPPTLRQEEVYLPLQESAATPGILHQSWQLGSGEVRGSNQAPHDPIYHDPQTAQRSAVGHRPDTGPALESETTDALKRLMAEDAARWDASTR